MRLLTISSLYPNDEMPNFGIFVENRLVRIAASEQVDAQVVAPVPWFPFTAPAFGRYATFAKIKNHETRAGLSVFHPRYLNLPKVGMRMAPYAMYASIKRLLKQKSIAPGDFDLIDAHYFYPDGVAAGLLAADLQKPLVITARGTDLNLIAELPFARRKIRRAMAQAGAVITVSDALAKKAQDIVGEHPCIATLPNGVDLETFSIRDSHRAPPPQSSQIRTILSVGNLVENKGHHLVIDAMKHLPDAKLVICGHGPEESRLRAQVRDAQLGSRVEFKGQLPHHALANDYAAADVLVLASKHEGWPNVLMESMACGTPVVASNTGGIPEIVTAPAAGQLFDQRDGETIANAVKKVLDAPPRRADTRIYAERFDWRNTIDAQTRLYRAVVADKVNDFTLES